MERSKEETYIQIGRVQESIKPINKKIGDIDKEIDSWPKRLLHLESMKTRLQLKISNKQKYINELENDLQKPYDPTLITVDFLLEKHPTLIRCQASHLMAFCSKHSINHKDCYGNGEIMFPKWEEEFHSKQQS